MKIQYVVLATFMTAACPEVQHAPSDSGFTRRDAASSGVDDSNGVDQNTNDAGDDDSSNIDIGTAVDVGQNPDIPFPDNASSDTTATDSAANDTLTEADARSSDGHHLDTAAADSGQLVDSSSTDNRDNTDAMETCQADDNYEPNDNELEAAAIPAPGVTTDLVGCDTDWYAFTLPAGRSVTASIDFFDADADLDLYIYLASDPTTYLDYSSSTSDGEMVGYAGSGQTVDLLLKVRKYSGDRANYSLSVDFQAPPDNDSCETAQQVTLLANGNPVAITGTTALATDNRSSTLPNCQNTQQGETSADLFYTFTTDATMDGHAIVELSTGSWTAVAYAFAGDCGAAADLTCDSTMAWFSVEPSTTYYVVVDAYTYRSGPFELNLRYAPRPDNDTCASGQVLSIPANGDTISIEGSTIGGSQTRHSSSADSSCQAVARYAPELFYLFTAATSGTVHLTLDSNGWESALYVFEGECSHGEDIYCRGEYSFPDPLWFRFDVEQGATYRIVVDGYGDICCDDASGPFTLTARHYLRPPPLEGGETCEQAVDLATPSGSLHGSTVSGEDDLSPNNIGCSGTASGYDKFYRFSLEPGQTVTARAEHSNPYNELFLYIMRNDCPNVRGDSCLASTYFEKAPSGEVSYSNSSGAAQELLLVVDADYHYDGEEYDLHWSIN